MPKAAPGPYTPQTLHRRLLKLLEHKEVSLHFKNLVASQANVEWDELFPPTNIRIYVDANNGQHIESVVHELLHVLLYEMFLGRVGATIEEVIVDSLEKYLSLYIHKTPARVHRWTQLIEHKLSLTRGPEEPYVERMDRSYEER